MRALSFTGIAVAFGGLLALGGMLAPKDAVRAMVAGSRPSRAHAASRAAIGTASASGRLRP